MASGPLRVGRSTRPDLEKSSFPLRTRSFSTLDGMLASRTGLTRLAWTCTTRLTRARTLSLQSSDSVLFEAENATLYPFGTPTSDPRAAIVTDLSWTLSTNQAWAVIGSFGSTLVDATLLGTLKPFFLCSRADRGNRTGTARADWKRSMAFPRSSRRRDRTVDPQSGLSYSA